MIFTDSNLGPQDASKLKPNETMTVTMEELKFIQGFYFTRMGSFVLGFTKKREGAEAHVWRKSNLLMMEFEQFNT